jgi:hypothetical protein
VRRLIAVLAALATALGLALVFAGPAAANVTAPAAGATLRGDATLTESGSSSSLVCSHGNSHIELLNSAGGVVFDHYRDDDGTNSASINTHNYPNGNYTVRGIHSDHVFEWHGFSSGCKWHTYTNDRSVRIQNITSVAYTGPTSGVAYTSMTVSAKLTDPNKSPTGVSGKTVTFSLAGGGSASDVTDSNGVATATVALGAPGSKTLTTKFAGDSFFVGDTDTRTITVAKDETKTTVSTPASVVHGQATHFTATVTPTQGSGGPTPTGTVQFKVDGASFGSPATVSGGVATSGSTSTLSTGDHVITAVYGGNTTYLGSTSAAVTQHVGKAQTTTSISQDVNPTVHGQAVTFTATVGVVLPGAGTPTGAVQFTVDGSPAGTAVPLSGDHATLTISNLHAGNHDVSATYNGDDDFASSTSATLAHGVDKAQTHLDLSTSDTTAVSGQPLTFTAQVAPTGDGAGDPSGTVTFFADGDQIGDPVALVGGSATSDTTHLLVGDHQITATYNGDDDFAGTSSTLTQNVVAAQTNTSIDSSPNPSVFGQPVTVHAEVTAQSPATGHPDGTIKFVVDGGDDVVYVDMVDGAADATLTGLAVGSHTVTAQYLSGDPNFFTSTSEELTQQVNKAATSTVVTSSSPTSVFGEPVTFTATVSPVAPGAGSPSGMVSFTDGSTILGTVPVDSSTDEQASITVSSLSVAQHAIVATYTGDGSFLGSDDSVTQKVQRAQTATMVTASVNPAESGQPVAFTATVAPVAPGAGDPTGTVTFTVNGAPLGNPVMVSGGTATSGTFATLSPGTYQIEATYSGDGHFVGSSGGLDEGAGLDVTKGATTMALESGPNPAAYRAPVTFTARVTAVAPATGRPSGVVQFWEGGVLLGASSLATSGDDPNAADATFVTSTLTPGAHAIRAVYVGNFNFEENSAETSQDIGTASTVTGITATPNPATYGDDVTLTATVAAPGATGTPTGTVTFRDGTTVLGTAPLAANGGVQQASLTVSGLHGGDHALSAAYSGDASFASSTSTAYTLQVSRAASQIHAETLITAHDDTLDIRVGIVKATLTGLGGAPLAGEQVTFTTTRPGDHAVLTMCQAVTDEDGVASCVTPIQDTILVALGQGYDATFAGNADYLPATDHGSQF